MRRFRRGHYELLKHLLLWGVLGVGLYMAAVMVFTSFKNNLMFQARPFLPGPWDGDLAAHNWQRGAAIVSRYAFNSVITALIVTALCILLALPVAFALGRYRWFGRQLVLALLLALAYLPGGAAAAITGVTLLKPLLVLDSRIGVVLTQCFTTLPVVIFILALSLEDVPRRLWRMAEADGAGPVAQLRWIAVPLQRDVIAVVSMMVFVASWDNVLLPMVLVRSEAELTIPVGLMRLEGEYVIQWGEMMAGYTMASTLALTLVLGIYLLVRRARRVSYIGLD